MSVFEYDRCNEGDRDSFGSILTHAFGFDADRLDRWFKYAGVDGMRVVRRGAEVVAGLMLVDMGQFFGGRAIPMVGIAAVAVRDDMRRRGAAKFLMRGALEEIAARGVPLSALYASTLPLYRSVGYETAGSAFVGRVRPSDLAFDDRELGTRVATEDDRPAVAALYRDVAAGLAGHLDRGPYVWKRIYRPRGAKPARGMIFERGSQLEAFVYYENVLGTGPSHSVRVVALSSRTARGYRHIWTHLRDLGTTVAEIAFPTAPTDPAFLVHPDPHFPVEFGHNWMLRLTDPGAALGARGYPSALRIDFALEIADDTLAPDASRLAVSIADGRAQVETGGPGTLKLDVRALAALFSGFASPHTLAAAGRLHGTGADFDALAAAFAGPAPWMPDMF